jgi:hypothetical protein
MPAAMATVKIDDKLYFDAFQYLYDMERSPGIGAAFDDWIRTPDSGIDSSRWIDLSSLYAGLIAHYSGEYNFTSAWDDDKTVVWSFYRAYLDRFGPRIP